MPLISHAKEPATSDSNDIQEFRVAVIIKLADLLQRTDFADDLAKYINAGAEGRQPIESKILICDGLDIGKFDYFIKNMPIIYTDDKIKTLSNYSIKNNIFKWMMKWNDKMYLLTGHYMSERMLHIGTSLQYFIIKLMLFLGVYGDKNPT